MRMRDEVSDILHTQWISIEFENYKDMVYFDTLHRAQLEAPYRTTLIIKGLGWIGQGGISLLGGVVLIINQIEHFGCIFEQS
jgi:ATP-binding cassette, subfamily B, bacterial